MNPRTFAAPPAKVEHADTYNNLGISLSKEGKLDQAAACFRQALALKPDYADAYSNLGNALWAQGALEEAGSCYRQAIALNPQFADVYSNYGNLLQTQGKMDDAVANYRRALLLRPNYPEAHNNLGVALQAMGKADEAAQNFRTAISLKPDYADAYGNLGLALQAQSRLDEAITCYRRALGLKPGYHEAQNNLGVALKAQGRLDEAIESFSKAASLRPDYAEAHNNLGIAFEFQGRLDEAVASYRRALQIKPDYAEAHNNLGVVLQTVSRLDEAARCYRQALVIKPDYADACNNLGNLLSNQGKLDEAAASYRQALAVKPDQADAYSNLLFLYGYHNLLSPERYLDEARGWEQACVPLSARQAAKHKRFRRPPLEGRRLKIGYVSGDYFQHPASYFLRQLFASHDRARTELFAYSTNRKRDAVTEEFMSLADHWIPLFGVDDATAVERIEADCIDVLVDLSGHTAYNRLGVFARRAAPVQAHYLGYFASTGLAEMDYWIGDEIITPPEADSQFTEEIWRLPRVWVSYEGRADAPPPGWRPDPGGIVWIGSFNNLKKLTDETLALWAKALHALPECRLLLKTFALADPGNCRRILDVMAGHGISADRIELHDSSITQSWSSHMSYYDRLDIALDPVGGLGGGTTTCDALWMGVPLVTLIGDRMPSRMTASMLHAIGYPEWIAQSEEDYIDKLTLLARSPESRMRLRADQRARMAQSTLCHAAGLAHELEDTYLRMCQRWQSDAIAGARP